MPEQEYTLGSAAGVFAGSTLILVALLVLFFPVALYCAWCDMHIWNWFVAPYFGLHPMTIWISYGCGLWFALQFSSLTNREVEGEKRKVWTPLLYTVLGHSFSLGIAAVVIHYINRR